jgi:hypothetical protein
MVTKPEADTYNIVKRGEAKAAYWAFWVALGTAPDNVGEMERAHIPHQHMILTIC